MSNDAFSQYAEDRATSNHGASMIITRSRKIIMITEIGARLVGILIGNRVLREVDWTQYQRVEMSFKEAADEADLLDKQNSPLEVKS